jgi:PAS domain S-box-containing protein
MPRVLILEDEKVVARDLQGILGTLGYETSMAASGEDALAVAKRDRPDLALVDIHLDGALDGIETAQAMRQMELPVVYLTAHGDDQTLERAKATEPLAFLVKPFSEPSLRATIQMAVHKAAVEKRDRSAEKWRAALLHQLTVALIAADDSGRVTAINARAQSLTGWSEGEALGRGVTEVLAIAKADKAPAIQTLVDQGLRGQGEAAPLLLKVVSRTGTETEVELRTSPLTDESEQIVGLSFVFGPLRTAKAPAVPAETEAADAEFDRVTGLPGKAQAQAALNAATNDPANLFAAVFVLDRYFATARRYGNATADEVLMYYCTFLAQEVQAAPHCRGLFRWSGPSFLAVFGPWDSVLIAQREISRSTRVKLVEEFTTSSHSVLLPVSATTKVFALRQEPLPALIEQIDAFVESQTKSGTL